MLAHVDANNFYTSCEQVFDPTLRGRPVVVRSNIRTSHPALIAALRTGGRGRGWHIGSVERLSTFHRGISRKEGHRVGSHRLTVASFPY